jgi:flavin-dependent dehydrogenase
VLNKTPHLQDKAKQTAQQIFSKKAVQTNPKHWKRFGCPVYVLDDKGLQAGSTIFHKWKQRANVGVYLGRSPQHARNMALVFKRWMALVSPQFTSTLIQVFKQSNKTVWTHNGNLRPDLSVRRSYKLQ